MSEADLPELTAAAVGSLRAAAGRFGSGAAAEKARLLRSAAGSRIRDAGVLLAYHDCLMFMLAYPETERLLRAAEAELGRVAAAAGDLTGHSSRNRNSLEGTGIAWSETRVAFSFLIARWLLHTHPNHVSFETFGPGAQPLDGVLELCLPAIEETILVSEERTSDQLLAVLAGPSGDAQLRFLIARLEELPATEKVRDYIYDSLHPVIVLRPMDGPLSRTFARGLPHRPFLHKSELVRRVDARTVIAEPVAPSALLTRDERRTLIDTARGVLAIRGRETDPIRLCRPEGVDYTELGRGVAIALFWMPPERRLAIDSHVGFMLFKNSLPVAYGGGWPFMGLCRIGVNIFDAFRGGESAFLFCQVLRVYRQRFGIHRFLVEAFQFGADNREGIQSGAFWFYYRLGFRPVDGRTGRLAALELDRMAADSAYRSPPRLLHRLARSDLDLELSDGDPGMETCDPADLSLAVTRWIDERFGGDRPAAERASLETVTQALGVTDSTRWDQAERHAYRTMCLLLGQVDDLERWPAADKRRLLALMRAKGRTTEQEYFDRIRTHRRFRAAMATLARS